MNVPRWLVILLCLLVPRSSPCLAETRSTLNLDGSWEFQLDPESSGESNQWYTSTPAFTGKIIVPGAWDAQGYGEPTDKLTHSYIGKGWYRREVEIPSDWAGKHVFICLGGVYRYAKVWVNSQFLGEHIGYLSDFEYDITADIKPGEKAVIAIQVDSDQRWDIDTFQGCFDIIDYMYTYWGGIWGHVSLEARSASWLQGLLIQPNWQPAGCQVSAEVTGETGIVDQAQIEIFSPDGTCPYNLKRNLSDILNPEGLLTLSIEMPGAQLWTPETPNLYLARLTLLKDGNAIDSIESRFGLRTIEIRDANFYLNGKKYFLNGYGDDCVYPETLCPPSNKEFYLDRLRTAKSYGFNYVRHHSHFVTPEYYMACDEMGMLVSPELPIGYQIYYDQASGPAVELYKTEWAAAIKRYRNHPSIFDWCMGNEMWNAIPLSGDLYSTAKKMDPTRPVIDSDGLFQDGFVNGTKDRETLDFYTIMFNIVTSPFDNPEKFVTGIPKKPIVSHEEGNFVTFPRMDEIDCFKHVVKPFWLEPVKERLGKSGLLGEALRWSENSERLYYLCHKENIEALRRNPYISGYQWWLLQPWYCGSNGLVDTYRRPLSIKPEQVRKFNGPVVVLQNGLNRTYRGNTPLALSLQVSNFSGTEFINAPLRYQLRNDAEILTEGTIQLARCVNGDIVNAGSIEVTLPDPPHPNRIILSATLETDGGKYTNQWSTWVFPAENAHPALKVPLYASSDLIDALAAFGPQPIPGGETDLPGPAVYIVRQPTLALLEAARNGSCVVMLSPAGIFRTDVTSFKPAWWLGTFDGDNNAGTVVYDHPAIRDLAPEGWCDSAWFHLIQGSQTFLLDDLPAQPHVLIRAINTHSVPYNYSHYADFERMWRNKSLLCEMKVGKGSMIVSGLNFEASLRIGGPEGSWILSQLMNYAATLPAPSAELSFDYLRTIIMESPFSQGSLISGFERLTYLKGEEIKGVSYCEQEATTYRIRQREPLHRVEWETAPTPDSGPVIFVFTGSFPFTEGSRNMPGFTVTVEGKRVVDFDATKQGNVWRDENSHAALCYVPCSSRPSWSQSTGIFYLSVPEGLVPHGRPVRLGIRSRGGEAGLWFGLNPYQNILKMEKSTQ